MIDWCLTDLLEYIFNKFISIWFKLEILKYELPTFFFKGGGDYSISLQSLNT